MTNNSQTNMKNTHWEIEYARYFNFPQSLSSTTSSLLRPIIPTKQRPLKGTWLSSSSSKVSLLIKPATHSVSDTILVVSLQNSIFEEHYISKLFFTWPHGSEFSGCALKASRVIFASYRDGTNQIQKFALRFSSPIESQNFMESLKCLKEGRNCPSGISHCAFSQGIADEHSPLWPPATNQDCGPHSSSEQAAHGLQDHAVRSIDVTTLPQSFTALLTDSCSETDEGMSQTPTEVDLQHFLRERNAAADSFINLMDKMDTVIIGLGGDLAI